jgi:DNA-binding MarR family transcriptional regulator
MAPRRPDPVQTGSDLREVVALLVRRFRAPGALPSSQTSALARLVRDGPATTSRLAALERIRPQSMAPIVADLEAGGFVERRPDPADGRQVLIEPTDHGRRSMEELRRDGVAWVARAIAGELEPGEQAQLRDAIVLLRRIAEAP